LKFLKTIFIGLLVYLLLSACNYDGQDVQERANPSSNELLLQTVTPANSHLIITPSPHPTSSKSSKPLFPSPTPNRCGSETGQIEEKQLATRLLESPMEYRVYLPPCYDFNQERRYPTLYLIHGYGFNDDQWERLGIGEISNTLIIAGEIPPLIIVMPHDNNHNIQPPTNQFGDAVLIDLVHEIDLDYRTITTRQYRAIGGLSRGGNWAFHIGLGSWDYFGAIGGHSSPLFVTEGPPVVKSWLEEIPAKDYPRIFLDVGDHDKWITKIMGFEELLDDYSVPHELYIFPGNHTEEYWKSHTEQYLRWYTEEW